MKTLNIEATKRLEEVRKALTCIAFAECPSDYEKEREKILEEEFDSIVAKYDIIEGYTVTQTIFKDIGQEEVVLCDFCATREEAQSYTEGLRYTHINSVLYCYEKGEK